MIRPEPLRRHIGRSLSSAVAFVGLRELGRRKKRVDIWKCRTGLPERQSDPAIRPTRNILSLDSVKETALKTYGIAYVATGLVFLVIDAIWLTFAAQRLYRPLMGEMLLDSFRLVPAVLFYLTYVAGIVVFAIAPAIASERLTTATFYGAFLGFVAYATYDLTNQATLRNWPVAVTIADLCWGTFLTASAATIGFLITRAFTASS
jgi:uncharacterized membrane protein